jgi:hypothetical protein
MSDAVNDGITHGGKPSHYSKIVVMMPRLKFVTDSMT